MDLSVRNYFYFYFVIIIISTGTIVCQSVILHYKTTTKYACVGPCVHDSSLLLRTLLRCTDSRDCKAVYFNMAAYCECTNLTSVAALGQTPIPGTAVFEPVCAADLETEVPDHRFTASSAWNFYHGPARGRLGTFLEPSFSGAWSAGVRAAGQFIQVEFDVIKRIERVGTQGRNGQVHTECVSSYTVSFSTDCNTYSFVKDSNDQTIIFPGNNDLDTIVWNDLPEFVRAVCVRVTVVTCVGWPSMRVGVKGCDW